MQNNSTRLGQNTNSDSIKAGKRPQTVTTSGGLLRDINNIDSIKIYEETEDLNESWESPKDGEDAIEEDSDE